MRKSLPECAVDEVHPQFNDLNRLRTDLLQHLENPEHLSGQIGLLLRECIDDVLMTARTGRKSFSELEKTEKTYIGTRVEIAVRSHFNLKRGNLLDTEICGVPVDIKFTIANNWMIPTEAIGHFCILVAADEHSQLCYLGIFRALPEHLTGGVGNRDLKRSLTTEGFRHILWIVRAQPYPANFWKNIPQSVIDTIFIGKSGNDRVEALLRAVQDRPISRDVLNAVGRQVDYTRRLRADGDDGVRDRLLREKIVVLSGAQQSR